MKKPGFLSFILCIITQVALGQVLPKENSKLNYLLTGFSIPANEKASKYLIDIADGTYVSENDFKNHIVISRIETEIPFVVVLPEFGKHYTWRVTYLNDKNKKKDKTPLYHFAVSTGPQVDSANYRLRVVTNKMTDSNLFIMTDTKAVIYDLKGKPVWYWPLEKDVIRDFKPTQDGTFTLISETDCYEIDYNGTIIWKAPNNGVVSGDTIEHYHHDFTKLRNGHYMVCGQETVFHLVPSHLDTAGVEPSRVIRKRDGKLYKKLFAGTLIEYDSAGNVVWSWKSSNFFPDTVSFAASTKIKQAFFGTGTHMNSFYFNETDSIIYISFRNINTVVKLAYPSGSMITTYGSYKTNNYTQITKLPFIHQHSCRISSNGELYLFNNNITAEHKGISSVAFFKEPENPNDDLTKTWEFYCDIDTNTISGVLSGGGVYELPSKDILVSMGQAGRIFIVDKQKNVLWNAIPETYETGKSPSVLSQYRAAFITDMYIKNKTYEMSR